MILSTDFIHIRIFAKNEKSPASQRSQYHHFKWWFDIAPIRGIILATA